MAKYLVTGGAGFIGSNIVEELVARGETVRVLDNFSTGRRENLNVFMGKIELIEGDIRSLNTVKNAMAGVDYVLHQAALPSVARSIEDPVTTSEVNINGTLNVLIAAKDAKVKRLVFASSSSVYGSNEKLPKNESMETLPISPYAVAKLTGEKYCSVFHHIYGLETVCLRYFNVFGPKQNPDSQYSAVIPLFIKAVNNDRAPEIHGDGSQSRDFTFVRNNVEANILACLRPDVAGRVFNIACGTRVNLNELLAMINKILGKSVSAVFTEGRKGDVKHSQAEIELARRLLGYEPKYDFYSGLEKTVDYFNKAAGQ
jgi:UDP-glucose 4-epimerase